MATLIDATERWRAALRPTPRMEPDEDPRVAEAAAELRRVRAAANADPSSAACERAVVDAERELQSVTWLATDVPAAVLTLPIARLRRAVRENGVTLAVAVLFPQLMKWKKLLMKWMSCKKLLNLSLNNVTKREIGHCGYFLS